MVDISDIKSKAQALRNRVSSDGDDQLGPDRGTMDQLEARKERARMEARQAAKKEKREQEVNQAREQGREEVFGDSPGGVFGTIQSAVDSIDIDDGGATQDMGFGSAGGSDLEDMGFGDGAGMGGGTGFNDELGDGTSGLGAADGLDGGFGGGTSLEEMGFSDTGDNDDNGGLL